jgi:hypothetical protein
VFWRIADLPAETKDALTRVSAERGLPGGGPHYFRSKGRARVFVVLFLLAAAAAAGLFLGALAERRKEAWPAVLVLGSLGAITLSWAVVLLAELARSRSTPLRPFLLVTPTLVATSDYGHGYLRVHRLADARAYQAVDHHDSKQSFDAREFRFTFPDGPVAFRVKDRAEIERVEEILARARSGEHGENEGAHLLPAVPGRAALPWSRRTTDPFGELWIAVAAILVLVALVGTILAAILG